jgi:hypothetical protein
MACSRPVRPWVFPGPSGLPASGSPRGPFRNRRELSSPALRRHPKRLAPALATAPAVPCRPWSVRIVPRVSFPALQHIRIRKPFFSLPLSRRRPGSFALLPSSFTLGFGYPPGEMVWLPSPRGPLSAPNARGLRPSELCSSRVIGESSRTPLSAPALSGKTVTAMPRRSSGLLPPGKPCP